MEPAQEPVIPQWLQDIIHLLHQTPMKDDTWKRLRVAVTPEEIAEYREHMRKVLEDTELKSFIHSVRCIPLVIEPHPKDPGFYIESL